MEFMTAVFSDKTFDVEQRCGGECLKDSGELALEVHDPSV